MFDKGSTEWMFREWSWILIPSLIGGMVAFFKKRRRFKLSEFTGELFIAGFASFVIVPPLASYGINENLLIALSGIVGHCSARMICLLEYLGEVKALKVAGVDKKEFEAFIKAQERDASDP